MQTSKGLQTAGHPDLLTELHLGDPDRISIVVIADNDIGVGKQNSNKVHQGLA